MTYEIVPIEEALIPDYRDAIDEVAKENKFFTFAQAPALEDISAFVKRNIEAGHPQFVVVADRKVVGWAEVVPYHLWVVDSTAGTFCIGLRSAFRGHGLGRRLTEHVLAAAFKAGFTRIDLMVRASNVAARALYASVGFEVEGIHRKMLSSAGVCEDLFAMALLRR